MHELSIADAVVAIAVRHAAGRPVRRVEVSVGHLRQVVAASLEFAFTLVSDGTVAEGAELVIREVPARGLCRACGREAVMREFPLQCPDCGGLDMTVTAGEELLVDAIECEDELASEGMRYGV